MAYCEILTTEEAVSHWADAWRDLHARIGQSPFTDYDWAMTWWHTVGKPSGADLAVVIGRDGDKLVAVIPFVVRKKKFARVLYLLGHEVFYYKNFLIEEPSLLPKLWDKVLAADFYDVANIKNIEKHTPEKDYWARKGMRIQKGRAYYCHPSGTTCETAIKKPSHRFCKRMQKTERFLSEGKANSYHLCAGSLPPDDIVQFMVQAKKRWTEKHDKKGFFDEKMPLDFYRGAIHLAADRGQSFFSWVVIDDRPAAALFGVFEKNALYAHTIAIDDAQRKWHPGYFLTLKALLWASGQRFAEMNLMEGEETYKTKFAQDYRKIYEYLYARNFKGWCFVGAYFAKRRLRRIGFKKLFKVKG